MLPTFCLALAGLSAPQSACAQAAVLTQNNDTARSGANTAEPNLTPADVKAGSFGKLFTLSLDANVNGQPLYAPDIYIKGAFHNVIYAYTSNNSDGSSCGLWAYDADTQAPALWHTSFPASARFTTATPVIDPATSTIYVLTKSTNDNGNTYLHAIDITTGLERNNSPAQVQATVPGIGDGSYMANFNGKNQLVVSFDGNHGNGTFHANDRAALLLLNGVVYTAFAYNTDGNPYHGWILGYHYDGNQFTQEYVFCTTPNGSSSTTPGGADGGIWQSGKGLVADGDGNIYCSVGNGTFDANSPTPPTTANPSYDYGMCYLKLSPTLKVLDYFSPYDEAAQSSRDLDTGNSGPVGIPGTTRLFAGATKFGTGFLYDSADLGQYAGPNKPSTPGVDGVGNVVQRFDGLSGNDNVGQNPIAFDIGSIKYVYLWPDGTGLEQFQYNPQSGPADKNGQTGQFNPAGVFKQSASLTSGGSLAVSSNGVNNAILWAVGPHDNGSANSTLYALNAADVSQPPLYSDSSLTTGHFQFPTVANGKVYVPTGSASIAVYGLLNPTPPLLPLYRSYDPYTGNHFYTVNGTEEAIAQEVAGYGLEGVIGYTPTATTGTAPIYRLFYPRSGDHFYTNSYNEAQSAVAEGYVSEGVGYDVFTASATGTLPLFRLYSPTAQRHFYTSNQAEHDSLVSSGAWNDEGILGYLSTGL